MNFKLSAFALLLGFSLSSCGVKRLPKTEKDLVVKNYIENYKPAKSEEPTNKASLNKLDKNQSDDQKKPDLKKVDQSNSKKTSK